MAAEHRLFTRGDRQAAGAALLLAVILFFSPALLIAPPESSGAGEASDEAVPEQTASPRDRGRPVRLLEQDGTVRELTMEDYLWGVVAAEMPASFQPEALKAQACAARTYTVLLQQHPKHENADVCADSHCCQAFISPADAQARWGLEAGNYTEKLRRAVADTDGLGILYGGEPIQALFFSSAAGKTVDAAEVWGNSVDYLKSVDSPEGPEVPNYRSRAVFSPEEVRAAVLARYPDADLSGPPEGWFAGEAPDGLSLGGLPLSAGQLRSLFSLRSGSFDLAYQEGSFVFSVTGYGHGVGMSQYGANAMARSGKPFRDILTWYYTGVEVGPLW